ncbi:MAG TPA: tetratricopeptide repeat protein, partial [Pyrinomonadaceae bacterium]|nr:tetratricopeptide repeat protein [Pyrinomonadaceae bacterium]
ASSSLALGQDLPEIRSPASPDKSMLGSIRGRVVTPEGNYVASNVKITLSTLRGPVAIIYTDTQGQFEFPELPPGSYQLEVEPADRDQFDVSSESVQVFRGMPAVVSHTLKAKQGAPKANKHGKTVSVTELDSTIPKSARKEFEKATTASQKGDADQAISHLRKAIAIHPNFVMARNDLGVQLLAQGKLEEAAQELRTAISLDPSSFNPALNLGIVLVQQHQFEDAATILRKALSLESGAPAALLYLGIASMALGRFDEAEGSLKKAYEHGGPHYALANFHLGQLYMNKGQRELALNSFQLYLADVPNAANSAQVRKLMAILQ